MSDKSMGERFLALVKDNVQRIGPEIGDELQNQVGRGASELANALFSGQAFVLYGHGQSHPANVNQLGQEQGAHEPAPEVQQPEIEQSRGRGM